MDLCVPEVLGISDFSCMYEVHKEYPDQSIFPFAKSESVRSEKEEMLSLIRHHYSVLIMRFK